MNVVPEFPIVYVRGFAGGTSGIDSAADDPFYGFNLGATHVRVGGDGSPQFYQFAGPMVRLMQDEDYEVLIHGDQHAYLNNVASRTLPAKSVWIYRFYDSAADTFGTRAVQYDLPTAADLLLPFVQLVLDRTGASKVWLVAHSMGGLICRSMIQRSCPNQGVRAADLIDRFFTYATPHNGIEFSVAHLQIPVPELAPVGAEIFNREVMYHYLTPDAQRQEEKPADWDAHDITSFDPQRVFCLVGTNAGDYGLVSKVVGPKSDGLVQIDNAYVHHAARAYVHRSHSGRYGVVNSEEGYQNLRRFLFGSRKVTVELINATDPPSGDGKDTDVWQAEVTASIRGLPVLITDEVAAHYCPIPLGQVSGPDSVAVAATPLATVFLLDPERQAAAARDHDIPGTPISERARYSVSIRVLHLQQKHGFLFFGNHLETVPEWSDHLIVDVGPDPDTGQERLWAAWTSEVATPLASNDPISPEPREPTASHDGVYTFDIGLPRVAAANILGDNAAIRLTAQPWD